MKGNTVAIIICLVIFFFGGIFPILPKNVLEKLPTPLIWVISISSVVVILVGILLAIENKKND